MGRRDEGARAFRIFAEPVDLVQSAWTSQWDCRGLDLCCDPASLRRRTEDGDLRRAGRVGRWSAAAEPQFHVLRGPFLAPPDAVHNARSSCRVGRRDGCGSCALQRGPKRLLAVEPIPAPGNTHYTRAGSRLDGPVRARLRSLM